MTLGEAIAAYALILGVSAGISLWLGYRHTHRGR